MNFVNKFQRGHKSWMEVFETDKKEEVERKCQQNEFGFRWLKNDWIEVTHERPALLTHPETHETVWFCQPYLYDLNPRLLGFLRYIGSKLFYCRKDTLVHKVRYGDGSKIPRKDIYRILDVLDENTIAFPWQKRDIMMLDNILTMHGRSTFTDKRRILTAMTKN